MDFKNITIDDKEIIQKFTLKSPFRNCSLSFTNLYSWSFLYNIQFALMDDFLLIRQTFNDITVFMFPIGNGNLAKVMNEMIAESESLGVPFCIADVSPKKKEELEAVMPGRFHYENNRNYAEYIYLRSDLATLKGDKLQAKRNHVNKFIHTYPDYTYHELTAEFVPDCLAFERQWVKHKITSEAEAQAFENERRSMTLALTHFDKLDLRGAFICVNGKMAAFTFGAAINENTFDVCVEKADTDIEGAYAMINYEFAQHLPENYVYVNREEDLGLEGLRKAKLSYQPYEILENNIATLL